jgi:hypothetical protein
MKKSQATPWLAAHGCGRRKKFEKKGLSAE